jgi:hypothetical protein
VNPAHNFHHSKVSHYPLLFESRLPFLHLFRLARSSPECLDGRVGNIAYNEEFKERAQIHTYQTTFHHFHQVSHCCHSRTDPGLCSWPARLAAVGRRLLASVTGSLRWGFWIWILASRRMIEMVIGKTS